MMTTLHDNVWRFIGSNCAVAALEFAMIMPVLLLLFLGSFDAGNAIVDICESARGDLLASCHHQSIW